MLKFTRGQPITHQSIQCVCFFFFCFCFVFFRLVTGMRYCLDNPAIAISLTEKKKEKRKQTTWFEHTSVGPMFIVCVSVSCPRRVAVWRMDIDGHTCYQHDRTQNTANMEAPKLLPPAPLDPSCGTEAAWRAV